MNATDWSERVVVVTGGGSGIGAGIVEEFCGVGAKVVVADISMDAAAETAARTGTVPIQVDVANSASVTALAAEVVSRMGRVDVVVNNAGVGPAARLADMTLDDWRWLIGVDLFGVIHGLVAFLPHLEANPTGGRFVVTSSMSGYAPMSPLGGYAVAKAGISALAEVLADELAVSGSKVGVTVLAPGPVVSRISDSQRSRGIAGASGFIGFAPDAPDEAFLQPRDVGRLLREAIERDQELVPTHPQLWPRIAERYRRIADAFGASG
ncbi:SDR family oxidoreductase [Microbacterium sp.]|uniref:SDR family oxidoreductase n=1 Tax=Microbacterium sp. TaxID=51671 RepID=UPI003A8EBC41